MPEIPDTVRAYREQNRNISDAEGEVMYYRSLNWIWENKKNARLRLQFAMMGLSYLEPFIRHWKKEYGEIPPSIPAITEATIWHAINGARGQLENVRDLVAFFPEVSDHLPGVEEGFVMLDMAGKVRKHLAEHPGTLQDRIKKEIGVEDGRLLSRVIHYMELAGQVKRREEGKTHALYFSQATVPEASL